jgi:hypothetical protein
MDRMPDAMAVFAKALDPESYAKNPQKAIEKMQETIKKGNLKSLETLPKVFKVFHEIYGPQAEKAMYGVTQQQNRFNNTLNDFKNIIFQSGLANATVRLFGALNNFLKGSKPLAAFLGGIAQGFADLLYYVELGEAYFLDFAVAMGVLNYETGKWNKDVLNAFAEVGEAAGILFGLKLIKWLMGTVTSFNKLGSTVGKLGAKFGIASGFAVSLLGAIEGIAKFAGKTLLIGIALDFFSKIGDLEKEAQDKNKNLGELLYEKSQQKEKERIARGGADVSNWWENVKSFFTPNSGTLTSPSPWENTMSSNFNPFLMGMAGVSAPKEAYQPPVEINLNFKGEGLKDFWDVQMSNQASSLYDFQLNK